MPSRRVSCARALSRACISELRDGAAAARVAMKTARAVMRWHFIVDYWWLQEGEVQIRGVAKSKVVEGCR